MRSTFATVVLVAAGIAVGTASFAGTSTIGTIMAMDQKGEVVTLSDGNLYYLPADFKLEGFKLGEKVSISWTMLGKARDASSMSAF